MVDVGAPAAAGTIRHVIAVGLHSYQTHMTWHFEVVI